MGGTIFFARVTGRRCLLIAYRDKELKETRHRNTRSTVYGWYGFNLNRGRVALRRTADKYSRAVGEVAKTVIH
jgi:hypothetical protein